MTTQLQAQRVMGGLRLPRVPVQRQHPQIRRRVITRYTTESSSGISADTYMVLGLSNCFVKNEDGKLTDTLVIEPLSAPGLECMAAGARTSFRHVAGVSYATALSRDKGELPAEFANGMYCDKFEYRCEAAARTWLRGHAQDNLMDLVPLGAVRSNFNFDLTDKRVLNFDNVVTDDDNIKQDISIDVYGRQKEEEVAAAAAPASTACEVMQQQEEDQEDDLDALLMA